AAGQRAAKHADVVALDVRAAHAAQRSKRPEAPPTNPAALGYSAGGASGGRSDRLLRCAACAARTLQRTLSLCLALGLQTSAARADRVGARRPFEQLVDLLVGRLRKVLVPQPDRVERVRRLRADGVIDLVPEVRA